MMRSLSGTEKLGTQLSRLLRVEHVQVQPGNSAQDELRKQELCRAAAIYIMRLIPIAKTMAVMGGTTMALLARQMPPGNFPQLTVLPARGGMGETVETQANMVAAQMAGRLGAQYKMLHLPDDLSREAMEQLKQRPSVSDVIERIQHPDILLFSIGRADILMQRRGIARDVQRMLEAKGAVAEALGMYFDKNGVSVLSASSVGLDLPKLAAIPRTVAVAGGADKAQAILAAVRATHPSALFIDEAAASQIMTILHEGQAV
jgi:central glycolytic genes regulator